MMGREAIENQLKTKALILFYEWAFEVTEVLNNELQTNGLF